MNNIFNMKRIILILAAVTMTFAGYAQVGINTEVPSPNAALHIEAPNDNLGLIIPQVPSDISLGEVDTIGVIPGAGPNGMDLTFNADGLVLYNEQTGCYNYWSEPAHDWLSLCGTPPPAIGTISCGNLNFIAVGQYIEKQPLTINNYIQVKIDVTKAGTYTITAQTTNANGYFFSTSGTFPTVGIYTVNLPGSGVPQDPGTDVIHFVFNGETQDCAQDPMSIVVQPGKPDYCIIGARQIPSSPWPKNQPLNPNYYAEVTIQVNRPGHWAISTSEQNGYAFSGNGELSKASGFNPAGDFPQTVTVNVPVVPGQMVANNTNTPDRFTLSTTGNNECMSSYPLSVDLAQIQFEINNCADIAISAPGGTLVLQQGVALDNATIITLPVTVTVGGKTQITATFAGLQFSTGSLGVPEEVDIANTQTNVILYPTTSGQKPNQSGTFPINLTSSKGGLTKCITPKQVTVDPAIARFTDITFAAFSNSNQWTMNPMASSHDIPCDMLVRVTCSQAGNYTLTTEPNNGVTWTGSGSVTAGQNTITLKPVGTNPKANESGPKTIRLNYQDVDNAWKYTSGECYFVQREIRILFLGNTTYSGFGNNNNAYAKKLWSDPRNFGPNGIVGIKAMKTYSQTSNSATTLRRNINENKIDIVVVGYNWQPNSAAERDVLATFVKTTKGALIYSSEYGDSYSEALITAITERTITVGSGGGNAYLNKVLPGVDDKKIINGKFTTALGISLEGKYIANDVSNAKPVQSTSVPAPLLALITTCNSNPSNNNKVWAFCDTRPDRFFLYLCDSGWMSGNVTTYANSSIYHPLKLDGDNKPTYKPNYSDSNSGIAGNQQVWNSLLFANALGAAIDYVAEQRDPNYEQPEP
jgi:hypothetical protein